MTQRFLLRSCGYYSGTSCVRRHNLQRLVRALLIIEGDPVSDWSRGVLLALEAMPVHALLLERSNDAFHHSVLLWTVWRAELLLQAVAAYPARVVPPGEQQAVVRAQEEDLPSVPQRVI